MKKLVSRISIALFLTLYACYPVHVVADEGRYKLYFPKKSPFQHVDSMYVLASKTGRIRYCENILFERPLSEMGLALKYWSDQNPVCGNWSVEIPSFDFED